MTPEAKRTLVRIGAGIAFLLVLIWLMSALESVTTMVMVSFLLAYILNPAVNLLNSWGISRSWAALIILFSGLLLIIILLVVIVPTVFEEIGAFANLAPRYLSVLQVRLYQLMEIFNISIPQDWSELSSLIVEKGKQFLPRVADVGATIFSSVFKSTLHILSAILHVLLVPVIAYYFMVSFEHIKQGITDLIPPYTRKPITQKLREIDMVLAAFIRGQLTICLILAALYSLGFIVLRIDLALILGIVSGLLFIIPYMGTLFAIIFGSLMALAKYGDLIHVIYVIGWIAVVQLLEGYVLTPRIVGHRIGLHPVVYILALIVGGTLFGFVGMLVAIPVAAVLKVLLMTGVSAYRNSYLYNEPQGTRSGQ